MSKKTPDNNQNELDITEMINRINRGGQNINQQDIDYIQALEQLSKPVKSNSTSITGEVVIPRKYDDGTHGKASVTSIGDRAFSNRGLKNITIPNSVTSIGDAVFRESGLTSITIPSSVTNIGNNVFFSCSALTSITFEGSGVWYVTDNETDWENKENGTQVNVRDIANNVTLLKETYKDYYWYKID